MLPCWPDYDTIKDIMPAVFKKYYPKITVISYPFPVSLWFFIFNCLFQQAFFQALLLVIAILQYTLSTCFINGMA